jgi:hypothetical protein
MEIYLIEGNSGDEAYSYSFVLDRAFKVKLDAEVAIAQIEELMKDGMLIRVALIAKAQRARTDPRVAPDQRWANYEAIQEELRASDVDYVARVNAIVPDAIHDIYQDISWDVKTVELV